MALVQAIENGKLVDTSASATSLSSASKKSDTSGLDKDAFLQLLVAQMKYQDPLEPTDNTEYISQLATFSQLEETQNLSNTMKQAQANDLVGKQVILKVTSTVTGESTYISGQVDYVIHEGNKTYLSVNDSLYSIDDLDTVADSAYMEAVTLAKTLATAIGKLPTKGQLTLSDEAKLTAAREAYDSLTSYQKQFIDKTYIEALEALEERMTELKKAAAGTTEPTEPTEPTDPTDPPTDTE